MNDENKRDGRRTKAHRVVMTTSAQVSPFLDTIKPTSKMHSYCEDGCRHRHVLKSIMHTLHGDFAPPKGLISRTEFGGAGFWCRSISSQSKSTRCSRYVSTLGIDQQLLRLAIWQKVESCGAGVRLGCARWILFSSRVDEPSYLRTHIFIFLPINSHNVCFAHHDVQRVGVEVDTGGLLCLGALWFGVIENQLLLGWLKFQGACLWSEVCWQVCPGASASPL